MKLAVIGSGYVGLTSGACFADMGNNVICVDKDLAKIKLLQEGKVPIFEPGLEDMMSRNVEEGRLSFSSDLAHAVQESLILFIAVGTPPEEDGSADLSHVLQAARQIAEHIDDYKIIVDKSTVPVGTADRVKAQIQEVLKARGVDIAFDVVSNPEFLKEGAAIADFMKPDRVVIGTDSEKAAQLMRTLYAPFCRTNDRVIMMGIRSAEMTKYAANAFLATKISYINEISRLCDAYGADVEEVRSGIGSDSRIGYKFIYPGVGYGGSCFPKDIKALIHMSSQVGFDSRILKAVEAVNSDQKRLLIDKIISHFGPDLTGLSFAIWGLAFKPQTDDMREAPSIVIINALLEAGAKIKAYDPVAMDTARIVFDDRAGLTLCASEYDALNESDAMLLITEWRQFRYPDFKRMKKLMKQPVIFDGRNQYDPLQVRELGFTYYGIGRP
ncbi:MAG: UDP-glucose/GDP-mannose dehydrogenase family protein [Candidatus Cloacimonadaceae bacterium]|jgi:UDPglucose 6-dehydrogenase|nr:UDP-glucose/GDP-mannose dehydrogenase family protein [Candidatus Cloacimonadota bacterium]MDY0127134.1 UDP-glucose/GDP-mannose dehydrogenase family protein [Candidatus Cloacimonadaceae bacterium]MCB5254369.1 UDP-glucose/GDP-mannose dehydrogenase family protein [Candidatus Cloacimonadota bacterium]MCK9178283.1 UDP-glucose/GDP-mannose dehydrogenase family protein [Candidatus Cloacimonadota bacterium]MCK9243004.1 UDP-glucose/GDP-mannose dehydrogenase family protein [Candidatus Cloacimonadota ba